MDKIIKFEKKIKTNINSSYNHSNELNVIHNDKKTHTYMYVHARIIHTFILVMLTFEKIQFSFTLSIFFHR